MGSATVMCPAARERQIRGGGRVLQRRRRARPRGRCPGGAASELAPQHAALRRAADYDRILALTDPALVGWVPDTGHILRGGQDILDTLRTYRDRIRYLHLKDVDAAGHWSMLGEGVCDTQRGDRCRRQPAPNFNGWLVLEEESDTAAADPAAAVRPIARRMRALRRVRIETDDHARKPAACVSACSAAGRSPSSPISNPA